jgi:hypothetical protein
VPLLNNRIIPGLSLTVSPYTWVIGNDLHLQKQSIDYPVGGIGFDPRFSFSFFPNDFMELTLLASYRIFMEQRGDTFGRRVGSTNGNNNGIYEPYGRFGGAGYRALDLGYGLKIWF